MGKALFHRLPPTDQPINETIAGHFRPHPVENELIEGPEENPHGCHCGLRLKIMVGGLVGTRLFPPRAKGPTLTVALVL